MWMHTAGETAWNRVYNTLDQQAQTRHVGIWNPTYCGVGPANDVPLKTWVMSDPLGPDTPDGEFIKVENLSATTAVNLAKWWVRDSGLRRFTFPAGTTLAPGHTITVRVGSGTSSGETFYWGLPGTIFENSANGGDVGDGAYLFDPRGNLRSYLVYPCLVACTDPLLGAVRVAAHPYGREYVLVRNVSSAAVNLYGYELRTPGGYAFGPSSTLQPGQTMEVDVEGSPSNDTALVRHMGIDGPYLRDGGGAIHLSTFSEIDLDCDAWGSGHC
jgi:hypothetical protein